MQKRTRTPVEQSAPGSSVATITAPGARERATTSAALSHDEIMALVRAAQARRALADRAAGSGPLGTRDFPVRPSTPGAQDSEAGKKTRVSDAVRRTRLKRQRRSAALVAGRHVAQEGYDSLAEYVASRSSYVRLPRVARCGTPLQGLVNYSAVRDEDGSLRAVVGGLEHCGSLSCCPSCAPGKREERAREVYEVGGRWLLAGGRIVFITNTLRHRRGQSLASNLDALRDAWQRTFSGRMWRRWRDRLGQEGWFRAIEVTFGAAGWHPHQHYLTFVGGHVDQDLVDEFVAWLSDVWADNVEHAGGLRPSRKRGVVAELLAGDEALKALAAYATKVQDGAEPGEVVLDPMFRAAHEVTRFDQKTDKSNHRKGRTPFELLDSDAPADAAAWLEYVEAMKGRHLL